MKAFFFFISLAVQIVCVQSRGVFKDGDPTKFKSYEMLSPASGPCDITEGSDGLVYIQLLFANKIARLNQSSGDLTEYDIPFTLPGTAAPNVTIPGVAKAVLLACALRTGYDGKLYASNGLHNQLVQHDVTTGQTRVFDPPSGLLSALGNAQPFNDITSTPSGIYFTQSTGNVLTKFDYATQEFTNYKVPTPLAGPGGIYYTSTDGAVYFTESFASKLGRLDPVTGVITEYSMGHTCGPTAIRAQTTSEAHGESTVWFACIASSELGGFNLQTKQFSFVPTLTPAALPIEVAQDYADNVFVTYIALNKLGVYNTKTGNYSEIGIPGKSIDLPALGSLLPLGGNGIFGKPVQSPTFGHDGLGNAMWFSEAFANYVVRYDLDGFTVA